MKFYIYQAILTIDRITLTTMTTPQISLTAIPLPEPSPDIMREFAKRVLCEWLHYWHSNNMSKPIELPSCEFVTTCSGLVHGPLDYTVLISYMRPWIAALNCV